jgi:hypothetical protein
MKPRDVITLLGGAAAPPSLLWSRAAGAQQPEIPIIRWLSGMLFDNRELGAIAGPASHIVERCKLVSDATCRVTPDNRHRCLCLARSSSRPRRLQVRASDLSARNEIPPPWSRP